MLVRDELATAVLENLNFCDAKADYEYSCVIAFAISKWAC